MYDSKLTIRYTCIQSFFWMGYAVIMGFTSLFLLNAGFTSSQIGAIIAAASLLSAVLQPAVAGLADRTGGSGLKRLTLLMTLLILAGALVLLLVPTGKMLTGLCYSAVITILQTTTSLVNALGVTGKRVPNFGLARGAASLAYASAALGLGYLTDWFGTRSVSAAMVFSFLLMAASVLLFPTPDAAGSTAAAGSNSPFAFFRKYPRYGIIIIGCTLLFISHVVLNSFTFQIVSSRGGGSSEMGTSMALSAIIEIPPMLVFGWMLKKAKCHFWFRISGIFFMLKNLGTLLCTNIPTFYAVQGFQLLGWGLITVSAVYYIHAIMAPEDAVKGQAYYTVSLTLGNVVGAVAGGRIIDNMGVDAMLVFGTVSALAGAVILLEFTEKTQQ